MQNLTTNHREKRARMMFVVLLIALHSSLSYGQVSRIWCMANCTSFEGQYCLTSGDVCGYPGGEAHVLKAIESLGVLELSSACNENFRQFLCQMYYPTCLLEEVLPVCYSVCERAYKSCGWNPESSCLPFQQQGRVGIPEQTRCSSASTTSLHLLLPFLSLVAAVSLLA